LLALNVAAHDAGKHAAQPLLADARRGLDELSAALGSWRAPTAWTETARRLGADWTRQVDLATAAGQDVPPTEAQVIGAVNRAAGPRDVVVCAAGGLPGELHRLWRTRDPRGYHLEYGYSCMGYEIAGGLGAKLALPDREVFVMVGDGSYLMMNSEIATSVAMRQKIVIVLLDNHGFGCINRLQQACGSASFKNLLEPDAPAVDFAAHARSLGAHAEQVKTVADLEGALERAMLRDRTAVVVIETDPARPFPGGGAWWDVPVPEVSARPEVRAARQAYDAARRPPRAGG
jgi:3D-(3,5/4)-trihydroxycyclohexane-1,2-dione acylhydrolase (decyclizing)